MYLHENLIYSFIYFIILALDWIANQAGIRLERKEIVNAKSSTEAFKKKK